MKIFIDCGFYSGGALRHYIDAGIVDDTWVVYAFEPNPDIETKEQIKQYPVKIQLYNKAVWTKNTTLDFHISGRNDAAGVKDLTGHTDPKEVQVKAINFSKFVSDLPEAYIICSMDIEGAEYRVLEKMLTDGSIKRINILDIEFHHRLMIEANQEDSQKLIDRILHEGTAIKLKVQLQ